MIDAELLSILCCPQTHDDLALASPEELERLNQAIASGSVRNKAGALITEPAQGLLIRSDRVCGYLIRDDIPIMLIDEAVILKGIL
jgi:uncharacterized protein YbaR (Trm112 family)